MKRMLILLASTLTACTSTAITSRPDGTHTVTMRNLGSHTRVASITAGSITVTGWDDDASLSFQATLTTIKKMWSNA